MKMMSKKYRVTSRDIHEYSELKVGDVVTKVEGSNDYDLYELPKHLYGKGHNAVLYNKHLNLKEYNYIYIHTDDLEQIKELENEA